jgi:predicted AlkP superfamily phosphohydrolase/phosphomutase
MKSPTIWTSIATGKGPSKHGIADFVTRDGDEPLYNSMAWTARPVWDILSEKGYSVGVVNWMVSWPARPVNGYNVSDRIIYRPEDGFLPIEQVTYPYELADELAPHARALTQVPLEEVARFFNGDVIRDDAPDDVKASVLTLRDIYATDETVRGVTLHLLESREQPDFLGVYLNGVDISCHFFWGPMDPSSLDVRLSEELVEACKDVIPRYYERMDALLGEIIGRLDEDSTIILCSDHGFEGPYRSPQGIKLGIWMHGPVGVVVAAGPGIEPGATLTDASVLDVTPTLLTLLDEPVARDMDGFVMRDILSEDVGEGGRISRVDTYEQGSYADAMETEEKPTESPVDDEILERLESLGYIE